MDVEHTFAAQVQTADQTFLKIIKDFDLILEIGTWRGGFSLWLYKNKKEGCKFRTYDIDTQWCALSESQRQMVDMKVMDCFSNECIEDIKNLIQTHGRTLLLCDGGHKNKEFNLYAQYLKPNDVIMLHDYMETEEEYKEFMKKNDWDANYESCYQEIKDTVREQNLEGFMYSEFKNILWGSFKKLSF